MGIIVILAGGGILLLFLLFFQFSERQAVSYGQQGQDGRSARLAADERFESRGTLFSPAEASFFGALKLAVGDGFEVFAKVRMADVLQPVQKGRDGKAAFNEISQKHLDFVICRAGAWEIVGAVELDDASHRRNAGVVRDAFVNIIFAGAGIPLVRMPAQAHYSIQELRQKLTFLPQEAQAVAA
jgi:hypothetical protein